MNKPLAISIGLGLLVVLMLFSTTYSVSFHEVAVKKRFGQSTEEDVIVTPGLQFKLPIFADQVTKYDTRMQMIESPHETIATADGQQIVVRAFLLWQVEREDRELLKEFDAAYRSIDGAAAFVNDRFKSAMLAGLSRYRFNELIGPQSRLREAETAILSELAPLSDTGIRPVSVGISQVLFPPRTSRAVLTRMQATRETLARSERSKGQAEAQRIESEARTMADRINAFAMQRAAEIRAAGDEEAARYIRQMGEEEELAIFLVWLNTFEAALSERTTMILETGYAPMHFLSLSSPLSAKGIPQPANTYALLRDQEQRAMARRNPAEAGSDEGERSDAGSDERRVREPDRDTRVPARVQKGN